MTSAPLLFDVEISIVNHQRLDLTRACLRTLPAACDGLRWHTTVVDNASGDGSAEALAAEFPDAGLLRNHERHGFGFNHNQVLGPVLSERSARYVLVVNNDTELAPSSVTQLVGFADRRPALGAVAPRFLNTDGTLQPGSFRFPTVPGAVRSALVPGTAPLGCARAESGALWLTGACLLLRVEALQAVGGFDTRFFLFFEDIDLAKRLSEAGWGSALCPEASVVHHNHQTVTRPDLSFSMACQLRRSCYLYMAKHHGLRAARMIEVLHRSRLRARTAKAMAGRARPGGDDGHDPRLLRGLRRYDPRWPLPHELAAP